MRLLLTLLVVAPLVMGLTDDEIAQINKRGADSNGRCGSYVSATVQNDQVIIKTNGLPDHEWGCVNENFPHGIDSSWVTPKDPVFDPDGPYCTPGGSTGVAKNGVVFFNPLALGGVNAVDGTTQETFDCCDGHPQDREHRYHYHKLPHTYGTCDSPIWNSDDQSQPQFLGVAFDGFPIYSQWAGLDTSKLDECHGTQLPDGRYAYFAVRDHFPYVFGCFKGKPYNINRIVSCPRAAPNELCSCQYGQLTYDDVTVMHKTSMPGEMRAMTNWYIKWAKHIVKKNQESKKQFPMPMEINPKLKAGKLATPIDVTECFDDGCSRDWSLIDGECREDP